MRLWLILLTLSSFLQIQAASQQPCVLHLQSPEYPPLARQARIEGKVEVTIRISKDGEVTVVGEPKGQPLLAGTAAMNLKTWKFSTTNAVDPVDLTVTYEYRLDQLHKNESSAFVSKVEMDLPSHRLQDLIVALTTSKSRGGRGFSRRPLEVEFRPQTDS